MRKEYSALIILTALLGSALVGFYLTQPQGDNGVLIGQQAVLGRFTGNLDQTQSTMLPLPDGLFQISTDRVIAPAADPIIPDGILYYHADNGFVSRADISSRENTFISETSLPGLRNVIWSPDRRQVITVFPGGNGQTFQYFDYQSRSHRELPSSVVDAVFSPDGAMLALAQQSTAGTEIVIGNSDGTNPSVLLKTRLPHIVLYWPQPHLLSFSSTDDNGLASAYLLSDTGELTRVVDSETGLRVNWSPDGSVLLYSTSQEGLVSYKPGTAASFQYGSSYTAKLCGWYSDNQNLACAQEESGELKINKLKLGLASSETIASNLIISPDRLFLTPDEQFLILLSASDHTLYGLKIGK
jgi:hypothetical protein